MTITTNVNKVSYSGDDVTTVFALGAGYVFFDSSELEVKVRVDATGVSTTQTITTQYSVSGGAGATGSVTMVTAPATGETLTIRRVMPLTQTADLVNNDTQDAEVVEDMVDKNTLGLQQVEESLDRTMTSPSDESASMVLPSAVTRAGKFLYFADDSDAQPTAVSGIDSVTILNDVVDALNQSSAVAAANKLPYLTGTDDAELTDFTAYARTLLDDADSDASRVTLGVETSPTGSTLLATGTTAQRDGTPTTGGSRVNTDLTELEFWNGSAWQGAGTKDVVTTRGDLIRGDSSGDPERLAVGTAAQVLKSDGTDPTWGSPVTLGTPQDTTSGTDFTFSGIPAGVNRIVVVFDRVSLSGSDNLLVQLGDAGGIETTGYASTSNRTVGSGATQNSNSANGLTVTVDNASGTVAGSMTLSMSDALDWVSWHTTKDDTTVVSSGAGSKTLSAALTQVKILASGTDTFDAGKVNILYE